MTPVQTVLENLKTSTSYTNLDSAKCDSDANVSLSQRAGVQPAIPTVNPPVARVWAVEELAWDDFVMPEPNTGCWLWMGTTCPLGYGHVRLSRAERKVRSNLAHRIAYERAFGPIPAGLKCCHRCDVPSCVNPDHLFLGTQKDNLRDMFAKGRARPAGVAPRGFLTDEERGAA